MSRKEAGANIFGTFLKNIQPGPSKSSVDLSQLTENVIDWSTQQDSKAIQSATPSGNPAVIPQLLRAIDEAATPLSIIKLVEKTSLKVDTVASALRDATATGLLQAVEQPDGGRLFQLTPDGRQLLAGQ